MKSSVNRLLWQFIYFATICTIWKAKEKIKIELDESSSSTTQQPPTWMEHSRTSGLSLLRLEVHHPEKQVTEIGRRELVVFVNLSTRKFDCRHFC